MPLPVFRRLLTWTLLTARAYDILHELHPNCGQLKVPTGGLVLSYLLSATTHAVGFNLKRCIHDFPHSKWVFVIVTEMCSCSGADGDIFSLVMTDDVNGMCVKCIKCSKKKKNLAAESIASVGKHLWKEVTFTSRLLGGCGYIWATAVRRG